MFWSTTKQSYLDHFAGVCVRACVCVCGHWVLVKTVVKIILPRPLLFFFFYIIISWSLKLEERVTESHIDHWTPLLQEPETVENPHLISMTPLTNLATVIALVMLIALSPALGAGRYKCVLPVC